MLQRPLEAWRGGSCLSVPHVTQSDLNRIEYGATSSLHPHVHSSVTSPHLTKLHDLSQKSQDETHVHVLSSHIPDRGFPVPALRPNMSISTFRKLYIRQ